jgi:hypothetical protein
VLIFGFSFMLLRIVNYNSGASIVPQSFED